MFKGNIGKENSRAAHCQESLDLNSGKAGGEKERWLVLPLLFHVRRKEKATGFDGHPNTQETEAGGSRI